MRCRGNHFNMYLCEPLQFVLQNCRNYLEYLTDLPWSRSTEDTLNIGQAKTDLEADHFGLDKAKRRILEFLAVRILKKDLKGVL